MSLYFPLFFDLTDRHVLVVGGGNIAARRIESLADFSSINTVIAPKIDEKILSLADKDPEHFHIICEEFREDLIPDDLFMALICTDKNEFNLKIGSLLKNKGVLVNVCSCKEESDFYFPGIAKNGAVVAGITASGEDHKLAKQASECVRKALDEL